MKILITGATGFLGRPLVNALLEQGHNILIVSRSSRKKLQESKEGRVRHITWNPQDEKTVLTEVDGVDAVINLAGEPIVQRWTEKRKDKILKSRIQTTRIIHQSVKEATVKPKVLINASAIGYYGPRGNEALAEEAAPGSGFLAQVCQAWEAHAIRVEDFNVRVVRLRIGIVLDQESGALKKMLPPFNMGLGGWFGSGNQWFSWIHREDLIHLILFCLDHEPIKGAVNAVSPMPVTNKAFSLVLAQVLKRPCLFPVPAFLLKLLLGELSEMILTGQRVIPKKAQEEGFTYQYPEIRRALEEILLMGVK